MSPRISPPKVDPRKANDLLRALREMAPHYTPEWPAKDDDDPGVALLKIFAFIGEGVITRLNRAPDRNFLAFLDLLGIRLLQARPARAPITFVVADGTPFPFLVPKGTQVSAPPKEQHPIDLPFETLSNMLAVPATMSALIAVDPEKDEIYKPPPGFLELKLAASPAPPLTVSAFSAALSKSLQLDPPDQVKKDDFLRIDQTISERTGPDQCVPLVEVSEQHVSEHLVVADVKGSVVTVTDPLQRDYVEGTEVQKVTQFEIFEGKNWQEHILYLGHDKYFAIKSEAQFQLLVEHAPGVSSNLQPFDVVWEFFAEIDKVEGWFEFQIDADGTQGLSHDGEILLTKPEGEIKETEISGNKSRWIRARLNQPLPAVPAPILPKIEMITLAVTTGGKKLAPDNAFHNDTPLTTAVPFFPFGTEPRIFDRFSIASEEAFSKPNAEVTLNFTLDATDLLAAPAAVVIGTVIRSFAHAAAGRLVEFRIDPSKSDPPLIKKHGPPPDTRIKAGSIPAVAKDTFDFGVGVFVRGDDAKVYMRYIPGESEASWRWIPLQAPVGELRFNPAAVFVQFLWRVFVVAGNQVFTMTRDPFFPEGGSGWTPLLGGSGLPQVDSAPFVLNVADKPVVFVTDVNGRTWIWDAGWTDVTPLKSGVPDPVFVAAENARPFAVPNAPGFRIFLRSKVNHLVVIDTKPGGTNDSYGSPELTTLVDSNPTVSVTGLGTHVYVRGSDSQLWSLQDKVGVWESFLSPSEFKLTSDPFAVVYTVNLKQSASVLSTSDKNALLEFRVQGKVLNAGTLRAGPLSIIILANKPSDNNRLNFVNITAGPGKSAAGETIRLLDNSLSDDEFAVLTQPLEAAPTTATQYDLLRQRLRPDNTNLTGAVAAATSSTVTLVSGDGAHVNTVENFLLIEDASHTNDQIREIASKAGDTVTVSPDWTTLPTTSQTYRVLRREQEGDSPTENSVRLAMLAASASGSDNTYNNNFLEIVSGHAQGPGKLLIDDYEGGATKHVTMAQDLPSSPFPDNTSQYLITDSAVSRGWFAYKDPNQTDLRPELSWEYWNGRGFVGLAVKDKTENFLVGGTVEFTLPEDIGKTEVAGQENFWIRARIVGGDYGRELFTVDPKTGRVTIEKDPIRPPLVKELTIEYTVTEFQQPQFCLTLNNLRYLDQTAANTTENKNFEPYVPLDDAGKTLYFGFNQPLKGGPIKIYFAAKELVVDERNKPKLVWQFAFENDWKELLAEDGTEAYTRPEYVSLNVSDEIQNTQQFGRALYWLRSVLTEGEWSASPLFSGVFLNTVEAMQVRSVREEILGSSTGVKKQVFQFRQTPVIEGEEVRVREALTEEEREQLVLAQGEDVVLTIRDQQDRVLETWIRWKEVIEFFDADGNSRYYRLDRHTGEIEFGDGIRGRIPPAGGDNIRAFVYQAGGGAAGNVGPDEINTPVTSVAGIDSVTNPVAAGGGSDAATNEDMLTIGPAQISHRDRAVTPDDFERLALEASREVRKARCLPNRNASGRHELGWTTVHIVPDSQDAQPVPSLQLRRAVQRYLSERADVTVVDQEHIVIGPPEYVPVTVEATVFAKSLDLVAIAEQQVKKQLEDFLHPLKGGPDQEGWEFGRDLAASDLYALLEAIDEVDHVGPLRLFSGETAGDEQIVVGADELIASGTHRITMSVVNGE